MKWLYNQVESLGGEESPWICGVCKNPIEEGETAYSPLTLSDEQADWIFRIWQEQPFEFCVCEGCLEGHCGYVHGLTPNKWLRDRIREYQASQKLKESHS